MLKRPEPGGAERVAGQERDDDGERLERKDECGEQQADGVLVGCMEPPVRDPAEQQHAEREGEESKRQRARDRPHDDADVLLRCDAVPAQERAGSGSTTRPRSQESDSSALSAGGSGSAYGRTTGRACAKPYAGGT